MNKNSSLSKIYLLSDTHLIADSLHDSGSAFQKMRDTSAGKDLDYQEIMLKAFVRKIIHDKPDAVIITGDLTFNGEHESAKKLAEIFRPLIKNKIAFYPVAGNHDINDGWARKFENNQQNRVDQISPQQWQEIFNFSYQKAQSIDSSSLAYSVILNQKYRLIFADSNIYPLTTSLVSPITKGEISKTELAWIESQLQEAQDNRQSVLFFMHHNLYNHNTVIHEGFTLENANELQTLFTKYKVKAVFTGHIHAQNIASPQNQCPSYDIASSCFCMCDQGYGVITLHNNKLQYAKKSFNYKKYINDAEKSIVPNNFHQYLKLRFFKTNEQQLRHFKKDFSNQQDYWDIINFTNKLNWNFFIGKSYYTPEQKKKILTSRAYTLLSQHLTELKPYIDSLLEIKHESNYLELKL
ncbi:metallophosphoesterase [uncultured Lactobacillus sp.]|uniref:metallophosphoesterase family protein n=1 Tax=uncultured Lactobacillus sp. TaxID=153152 RepID=UPI00260BE617|nr:metallophosphoesterase [uncultured Lactobacillus sp.]